MSCSRRRRSGWMEGRENIKNIFYFLTLCCFLCLFKVFRLWAFWTSMDGAFVLVTVVVCGGRSQTGTESETAVVGWKVILTLETTTGAEEQAKNKSTSTFLTPTTRVSAWTVHQHVKAWLHREKSLTSHTHYPQSTCDRFRFMVKRRGWDQTGAQTCFIKKRPEKLLWWNISVLMVDL